MRRTIIKLTILCLISISPMFSLATINLCKQKFYDGNKAVTKSCKNFVKHIDDNYVIYDNKVWFATQEYDVFNRHRSGGGCPNPSCVGSLNVDLNPLPTVKKNTQIYTALALDASKVKLLKTNCISDGDAYYITDGNTVYYLDKKLDITVPENFQLYQCHGNDAKRPGSQLAMDGQWLYINGKRSTAPAKGEIQLVNESYLRIGQDIYSITYNERNIEEVLGLEKRNDVSSQLYNLPGEHLSTDGRHLFYRDEIIDDLQGKTPTYVNPECPVVGYPLITCRVRNNESLLLRTNTFLWVQFGDEKPRGIKISANDNIHYFNNGVIYVIINDNVIYRLNRYGKLYDQVRFHGFLAEVFLSDEWFSNKFFDAKGVIEFGYAKQTLGTNYRSNLFVDSQNPASIYILDFSRDIYSLVKKTVTKGQVVNGIYRPAPFSISDGHDVYHFVEGRRVIAK